MEVRLAFESKDQLGEGPVWSVDEQAFYWVDIVRPALQRWEPKSGQHRVWELPADIGSFALRESGGFIVALRSGLAFLDSGNGEVTPIINPEADLSFTRFNDGKCDRKGRFWAGTMDEEPQNRRGALYRLGSSGGCIKILGEVGISNGLGWSPDNSIFYFTDSIRHTIFAYDFDPASGEIENERIFAQTPENYVPDGLTVDSDGFVWSAKWDGWKIVRYAPDGEINLELELPVQRPTSCTFGGKDLTDLFITSAKIGLTDDELKGQPDAGCIFIVKTNIRGLPEPKYRG